MIKNIVVSSCRHGAMHHFAEDATIGQSLARFGEWAEYELALLSKLVSPGATVLDVGANIGCHSVAFSRMVGPRGKVISFEPFPENYTLLSLNTRNCGNVTAVQAMVGTADKFLVADANRLVAPGSNMGAITFVGLTEIRGAELASASILAVSQITLDIFAGLPVGLIKIDVEGMEFDVFVGARQLLQVHKPILYFEQNEPVKFRPIAGLLRAMGYKLFWHLCYPFNQNNFRGEKTNLFGTATELNVLAVHSSAFEQDPGLFDRIKYDVNEVNGDAYEPPMQTDVLRGRAVRRWESELVSEPSNTDRV